MGNLPISVIVPHKLTPTRNDFFRNFCLPSIQANDPAEIVVMDNQPGGGLPSAARMRNQGVARSNQPYLFCADDDTVYSKDCLRTLLAALEKDQAAGYAYCAYVGIRLHPPYPMGERVFVHEALPFDARELKIRNYISTMSLIRRAVFPGFDETLRRYNDWSMWLTLLSRGVKGHPVQRVLFHAYYIDDGVTGLPDEGALETVRKRHGIIKAKSWE